MVNFHHGDFCALFVFHSPLDTAGQIVHISLIPAHSFTFHIGDLGHRPGVAGGGLHYDIQRRCAGIVTDVGADAEGYLGTILVGVEQLVCSIKIQTVAEQQSLGFGVNVQLFIMGNHLVCPAVGIPAVVADAAEEGAESQIEILQEAVSCGGVGQSGAVEDPVFLDPGIQSKPIGVGCVVAVVSLSNTHGKFMGLGAYRQNAVFFAR